MLFVIRKFPGDEGVPLEPYFDWMLHPVAKGERLDAIARSVKTWDTEAEARSEIASVKIKLKGARFAKVLSEDA